MEKWQHPATIALWIISFILVVLLLTIFIVLLVRMTFRKIVDAKLEETEIKLRHQEMLLETSILVQEKERGRIAADIHDELVGKLLALQLKLHLPGPKVNADSQLSECITVARRISHDLVPPMIGESSLLELMEGIVEPFEGVFKMNTWSTGDRHQEIAIEVKTQVTRIVRECLVNTRKHASATEVSLLLKTTREKLFFIIRDNGSGYDQSAKSAGLGLKNIETRTHFLKGNFKIKSAKNKGTSLLFAIPLNIIEHE